MTVLTVDFNLKHGFLERVLRIKTNNFIVVFLIFIQLCDSRKIHYLTSEFHVKLHLKTDIARIPISIFACNLTRNARVRYYEFSYKITMQSVTQQTV